jgi:alkyl hydroperoxide reductase subunit AhpC
MNSIARKRTLTGILAASFGALGVALATGAGTVAPSYEEGVKVGDKAPDFTLTDIHGEEHKLSEYTEEGKIVVLEWFNPDCPFVKKFHYKTDTMRQTYAGFEGKPVEFLAINSASAPNKQGWGEERNIEAEELYEIEYPILLDKDGSVGKSFGAKRTPHIFIVDAEGVVRYIGPIDSSSSYQEIGEKNYIEIAVNQLLDGESEIVTAEIPAYGCAVKYVKK